MFFTGFILKLKNPENWLFLGQVRENLEYTEFSIVFIQVRESNILLHVSFSLTLSWLFGKWLFHLLSVNVNFITLHIAIASICALPVY